MVLPLRGWSSKRGEDDQAGEEIASNSDLNAFRMCQMASIQVDRKGMLLTQGAHGSDLQNCDHAYADPLLPYDVYRHDYGRDQNDLHLLKLRWKWVALRSRRFRQTGHEPTVRYKRI